MGPLFSGGWNADGRIFAAGAVRSPSARNVFLRLEREKETRRRCEVAQQWLRKRACGFLATPPTKQHFGYITMLRSEMDLDIWCIGGILPRKTDSCWWSKHQHLRVNVMLRGLSDLVSFIIKRFQSFHTATKNCFDFVLECVSFLAISNYKSISLFTRARDWNSFALFFLHFWVHFPRTRSKKERGTHFQPCLVQTEGSLRSK